MNTSLSRTRVLDRPVKPEPVIEKVLEARNAGVDHLYFHQIGSDQDGFVTFWQKEIRAAL